MRARRQLSALLSSVVCALTLVACGGATAPQPVHAQLESPEDEILAVANAWEAHTSDSGLRSEPDKISVFTSEELRTLRFTTGSHTASQSLLRDETFHMRDGRKFACRSEGTLDVSVRFYRKNGEPVLELTYPAVQFARQCDNPGFPEPTFKFEGPSASFVLREENLVGFDPVLAKRTYVPAQ
jgi:hypothetical protein